MSKRPAAAKASPSAKKGRTAAKAAADPPTTDDSSLPLDQWRVVLTGDFVVKPKAVLEGAVKDKGGAVTGSVSGKTTHLILGESGVNDYGKKTGVGSSKHNQAVERGLTIVTEREAWAILTGAATADELSDRKRAAKVKATKSSSMVEKVVFCVQETGGGGKVSLPKLKAELQRRFDMNLDNTRSKNSLKSALTKLVDENKLVKEGASYKLPDAVNVSEVTEEVGWTPGDKRVHVEDKIKKYCPVRGRWRGLYALNTKKATGRAICGACRGKIEKGEQQVQVSDDSLFRMVVWPEDCHEGVTRGYVECGYPGHEVIARTKFFIHPRCKEAAERRCEEKFRRDWAEVRPHEVEGRRQYLEEMN